jgi:hypothetical protein
LILSGQKDSIFPPDGYHAVFGRGKKIYDLYAGGDSDRIREVDDNVEHSDPPLFLREARQWMQRWIKGDSSALELETNKPPRESAADLACLPVLPSDATNYRIHNEFVPLAAAKKITSRAGAQQRASDLKAQLQQKVFGWFPTNPIPFETKASKSGGGWVVRYGYADYKDASFQSEKGVRIRAQLFLPKQAAPETPLLIFIRRTADSFYSSDVDELLPLLGRGPVLVLNPRLTEQPLSPAEFTDVERTASWVGRTIAAMQVWDVLRAVRWITEEEKLSVSSISLYGKGEMGVVALYAGLFEEQIKQVILNDSPASHWQGPALLNILRVTDIPEVAAAFAPRRLLSLTKMSPSFEPVERTYKLHGASKRFGQVGSLAEAMEVWTRPLGSGR